MTDEAALPAESKFTRQTVTASKVWLADKLFSIRITRDPGYQFVPGQFARLGLPVGQSETQIPSEWRAYSMVSHPAQPELEFFSVEVPEGKFSPAMSRLRVGDAIFVDKTSFGFLTLERFADGEDLWLISTGTGLSAYLSMLREPSTWARFKRVLIVHGVRHAGELAYRDELLVLMQQHPSGSPSQLIYLPVTSQEPATGALSPSLGADSLAPARITTLLDSGELERRAHCALNPATSRVMLCGNPAMVTEMRAKLAARGFAAGRRGVAGNLAVENYW